MTTAALHFWQYPGKKNYIREIHLGTKFSMTKYKRTELEEDETSSNGSAPAFPEMPTLGPTRIMYHKGHDLWTSRSLLEKILLVFSLILVLVVIVLSATVSILSKPPPLHVVHIGSITPTSSVTGPQYCLSRECITASSHIITSMDQTVNPCEDFYQYSCGGWIKENPIPDGKFSWSTFEKLWQTNELIMKKVIEQPLNESTSEAEKKAQIYYFSCLDRNGTIDKLGAEPITDLIAKVGGWSVSGEFDIKQWNFQTMLQTLHNEYNLNGLFDWGVDEDARNSMKHVLEIDQGGLTLPTRDYYLNKTSDDEVLSAFLKYMTQVGVLLGGEENATRAHMQKIIEFETKLASITISEDERRDGEKLYNKMTISNLTDLAPEIEWIQYFETAFKIVGKSIEEKDYVIVIVPNYFRNLSIILNEYLSTSEGKTVIANYLVWHMINSLTSYLSKPFRDAHKILQKAIVGADGGEVLWRYCVSGTNNVIGFAVGAMFVREVFHGENKPMAEKLTEEIRIAFKENLNNLKWMDGETRKLAKEKADAITNMIGFPDYILDARQLDEKYAELEFTEDEYFNNNLIVRKFVLKKELEKLDKPVNKTKWGMPPATINAYYSPTKNQMVFPAGILQAPFYDSKFPRSLNYGGMGVVMGHELVHAFDDQGRKFDKTGNLNQWWKNSTTKSFHQRAQCFVDQYSNYSIYGENLHGRQTLGENIADNGGLKAAYRAYNDWVGSHYEELPLPGVNLTHRQLFFIGFAQVWCSASTKAATHLEIVDDSHTPPKFRVLGPLSNFAEFADQFKCPLGSPMRPIEKCEIW